MDENKDAQIKNKEIISQLPIRFQELYSAYLKAGILKETEEELIFE
jgi:hypothetical protein